jgi:hypothetical protein
VLHALDCRPPYQGGRRWKITAGIAAPGPWATRRLAHWRHADGTIAAPASQLAAQADARRRAEQASQLAAQAAAAAARLPDHAQAQARTAQCVGGLEQAHLFGVGARTSPERRFASSLMLVNSSARKRRLKSMISDGAPATNGPRCVSGSPRGCPA